MWVRKPFDGNFQETSPFGPRVHPVLKTESFHKGIDFYMPIGTPLVACSDGDIETGYDKINGKFVKLHFVTEQKTQGYFLYDHLSKVTSRKQVKTGDKIGESGKSGRVTGPCLHFGLSLEMGKKRIQRFVDPKQYVDFS